MEIEKKGVFFAVMKKISLLDKFRLTDRFMEGKLSLVMDAAVDATGRESVERDGKYWVFPDGFREHCRFSEGDALPVVMSYQRARLDQSVFGNCAGWSDKRCVDARYIPHRLVVDKVRCVRAWDITEEEALRMGMSRNSGGMYFVGGECGGCEEDWRRMFGRFFDRMFKVPYALNPWVVVYEMTPVVAR